MKKYMLKDIPVVKTVILFIIPYVVLYAIYIQINGEVSPGGGFQAGVIFSAAIIGFDLISGSKKVAEFFSSKVLCICSVLGVLLYAGVGLVSFCYNDHYLNYYSIAKNQLVQNKLMGQYLGIFVIEIGVGLTVSSIMCLIYLTLREE